KIAALPEADQANYRAILRRYHIWLRSLPDEQRKELDSAPASEKMAVVAKLRAVPRRREDAGPSPLPFQLADVRGRSPFEVAHSLQTWFRLSPAERAEVDSMGSRERLGRLTVLARKAKIVPPAGLTNEQVDETLRDLEKNAQSKGFVRANLFKKAEGKEFLIDPRRRMANNYYFLLHPPQPVSSKNLLAFEAAMP